VASCWQLPNADHYLKNDNPIAINLLIRQALGEEVDFSGVPIGQAPIEAGNNSGN